MGRIKKSLLGEYCDRLACPNLLLIIFFSIMLKNIYILAMLQTSILLLGLGGTVKKLEHISKQTILQKGLGRGPEGYITRRP